MTDYRVVYIEMQAGVDGHTVGNRIEKECDRSAQEGWYLDETIPDVENGTTRGIWLVFASEDEDATNSLVMQAERIVEEAT